MRDKEFDLMCPNNRIGMVDLFIASGHGGAGANSEALVHAIRPRIAVVNNGPRKGGQAEAMRIIHSAPRLQDVWQLHFSLLSGQEHSAPGLFIANWADEEKSTVPIAPATEPTQGQPAPLPPAHDGTAHWIKISAQTDETFTVTNSRNQFSKTYRPER